MRDASWTQDNLLLGDNNMFSTEQIKNIVHQTDVLKLKEIFLHH